MDFDDTIKLCTIIKNICNTPDSCIMFGDFNFPGIHWLSGSTTTQSEEAFYKQFKSQHYYNWLILILDLAICSI